MVVDINSTLVPIVESSIVQGFGELIGTVSIAIGGIFSLYLVLIFLRWKESRDVRRLLCEIRDDLKELKDRKKK